MDHIWPGWWRSSSLRNATWSPPNPSAASASRAWAFQLGQGLVDLTGCDLVQGSAQEPLEVLADVGLQHAHRAQGAGVSRHEDLSTTEPAGHGLAVHRSRTARCDQGETPRRVAALDGDVLHRPEEVLFEERDDARGGVLHRHAQGFGNPAADGLPGGGEIEVDRSPGVGPGSESPEHQLRIGDRRLRATQAVAGRAGIGAGPVRTHEQQARGVDSGDRAAARADRVNVHRRGGYVVAGDLQIVADRYLSRRHQQHVAGRPANLHRDQVAFVPGSGLLPVHRAPIAIQGADRGSGPAEQQVHRARSTTVSTDAAPPLLCTSRMGRGRPSRASSASRSRR